MSGRQPFVRVRIDHTLTRDELVAGLGSAAAAQPELLHAILESAHGGPTFSKAWVLTTVKARLWNEGYVSFESWRDDLAEEDAALVEEWAKTVVDLRLPELVRP